MLPAQAPAASGSGDAEATFRAGTEEVLVDAVVVDKKGRFQRDLTARDFKIWEDGKEQKITSFSLAGAGVPGHSSKHFLALVFDSETPGLREEVMQFVDRFAAPDLYLAVFSRVNREMRLQQDFTPDAARIKAALRAMQVSTASPMQGGQLGHNPFLERIGGVAAALAPIRGRKALILFSYGFLGVRAGALPTENGYVRPAPKVDQWLTTIDSCNAANVSLYSFINESVSERVSGAPGDFYDRPENPADDHGGSTDRIRDLAIGTGGKYTPPGTYDLAAYLGSVAAEQDDYYLLGYTPSADAADKPCHKLKVKVDRSGLEVDARDSYCTSSQLAVRALKPAQRALEARAASGVPGNIAAGMQLSWFYSKPNVAVVDLAMDIDPAAMKVHGKLHGEFNLSGVAYREDGSVAARAGDTVELDFDTPAQLNDFLKVPYHYSNQFSLAPGRYRVRMAVGSGDQAFGSAEKLLDIDSWSGQTMSVSGIALSARDYPLTGVTAELDNSMLEGPRRLASKGRVIVPMGGAQFAAGQNGLFYFEVYEPRLAQATAGQPMKPPAMRFRILDRATGQEKNSESMDAGGWMQPGNPVIPIALNLPVSNLPAGSYTLEVRVTGDSGPDAVVRSADFDVK